MGCHIDILLVCRFHVPDVDKACERFEELGVEFVKKPNAGNMKGLAFIKVLSLSLCSSTISTFACLVSCCSAKVEAPSTTCWYAGPRWLLDRDLERPELDKIGVGVEMPLLLGNPLENTLCDTAAMAL